jgi:phosphatidylserine decarboxylase
MKYIDRKGNITIEETGQDKFLRHLYHDWGGRICLKILVRPFLSRMAGAFLDTGWSARLIPGFAERNHIDLSECRYTAYHSFNDFFTRELKEGARPVAVGEKILISPCDGKATVCRIGKNSRFYIKDTEYTTEQLLRDERLARRYQGGYAVIFRLSVDDYHRYCYVAEGVKSRNVFLKGKLHTVNPVANAVFPIYAENAREYTLLQTPRFGTIVMMEVGAMLVGRISNRHKGPQKVEKGQEKGWFEYGGSTIVLLLQKDKVRLDYDLIENSENGYETIVKMGERIGEQKLPKRTGKTH